jgi:hypothetical protein
MFSDYARRGLVRSFNWDDYQIYSSQDLFAHPSITDEQIVAAMHRAYRDAILLNPGFIGRRLRHGLHTGDLIRDGAYFLRLLLMQSAGRTVRPRYYGRDRWRVYGWNAALPGAVDSPSHGEANAVSSDPVDTPSGGEPERSGGEAIDVPER